MRSKMLSRLVGPAALVVFLLASSRPCLAATVQLFSDDFEGAFPGPWTVLDQSAGAPKGTWDTETDEYVSSNHSCYCCGSKLSAPPYSNGMEAWLDYGPFDLSNALSASVAFNLWAKTEVDYDGVVYYASTDGLDYSPLDLDTGDTGGWVSRTIDLSAYCGESEVWFAFIFISDSASGTDVGVYIDDVVIEKVTDDPYEENDKRNDAWDFSAGVGQWLSAFGGSLGAQFDEDWFFVRDSQGDERLIVECQFTHANGNIDLEVRNGAGFLVAESVSTDDDEYIDVQLADKTFYYVVVIGADSGNTYDLRWSVVKLPIISQSPNALAPSCGYGEDAAADTFTVQNTGAGTLNYTISDDVGWLDCAPASGTSTGEADTITVTYTTGALAPGTYPATITISDPLASNNPQTIAVNLTVVAPAIGLSTGTLSPSCNEGTDATADTFTVQNAVAGTLNYTISDDSGGWLSCSPTSGTSTGELDTITVNYATSGLAPGAHQATITVADPNADNDPQTIIVDLTVVGPAIGLSTGTLSPSCNEGTDATAETFTVTNTGGGTLNYTISDDQGWLDCAPASGTSTGEADTITVTYTTSALTAGIYNATITVTDPAASNDPQTVAVTLTVSGAAPLISLDPTELTPGCLEGQDAADDTFTVTNAGGGTLNYTIADDSGGWLSCSPASGSLTATQNDTITVTYTTSGLAPGVHNAAVTVSAPGASNTPQTLTVTLTVTGPAIGLSTAALSPTCTEGQDATAETFDVQNTGGGTLNYTIADDSGGWMSCSPASGDSTGEADTITVTYTTAALAPGIHTATITVGDAAASNSPQTIAVTLVVNEASSTISLSTNALSPTCDEGQNAANDSFTVSNTGGGTLSYTISDDAFWIACTPDSGDSTGEADAITVTYTTTGFMAGAYQATITVTATGATNDPQTITVSLTVNEPAPTISLSPLTLSPVCQEGQDATAQMFAVENTGGGTLSYAVTDDAAWLSCMPDSGTSTGESDNVFVMYTTSGLAAGAYGATITVTDPGATNDPQTVTVNLTVNAPPPAISLSATLLNPTCAVGEDAVQDVFTVSNKGGGTLNYTVGDSAIWLDCAPAGGTSTGEADVITVTYTTSGLGAGGYLATITVSDPAATNDPQTITVSLTIMSQMPDLVVTSVVPATSSPKPGETVTVEVTVENLGDADAGSFAVDLFYNPAEPPAVGQSGNKTEPVASLTVGGTAVVTFTGVTCVAGEEWKMYVCVDSADDVAESDELNNVSGPSHIYWGGFEGHFYLGGGCGTAGAAILALLGLAFLRRR